ncbi:TetR family transcriptional regulator [Nocardia sp. NBC_01327]|uniref:TetR family transcriptional regulator n=1 Tax=Nocardia sp. NBC_01327 TaxID=2903593 RepID=UPI002E0DE6A0|nr:TetR family transcriptional regulator [Nocardia sp. NBC_01327]
MSRKPEEDASKQIISVVLALLESEGYDAVQLREVARLARVSLATVYKRFPARDDLIVAAIEQWMADNSYAGVLPPAADETLYSGLMRVLRYIFEPWERNPRMLEAYHRARTGAGGQRLDAQGMSAMLPIAAQLVAGAEPAYVEDIGLILANMTYALTGRFVDKTLEITEILPILERAVFRLTSNNESAAAAARLGRNAGPFTVDPSLASPYNPNPGTPGA